MNLSGKLANLDQDLLQRARQIDAVLPALRKRYNDAAGDPKTKASDLANLYKGIGELERALARIRFQPDGEKPGAAAPGAEVLVKSHSYREKRPNGRGGWTYIYENGAMGTSCARCGGSGQHSFHVQKGTVCFKCNGAGSFSTTPAKEATADRKHKEKIEKDAAERVRMEAVWAAGNAFNGRLAEHYAQRTAESLGHIDPQHHHHHHREWYDRELRNAGINPRSLSTEEYHAHLDKLYPKKSMAARLVVAVEREPSLVLSKAKKGDMKPGHKYKSRKEDGQGGWIYEYDDGSTAHNQKKFKIAGVSDEVTECGLCGRTNLKRTVVLQPHDGGDPVFYGTDCASRALGWSETEINKKAAAADRETAASESQAFVEAHPLYPEYKKREDAAAGLTWREQRAAGLRDGITEVYNKIHADRQVWEAERKTAKERARLLNVSAQEKGRLGVLDQSSMRDRIMVRVQMDMERGTAAPAPAGFQSKWISSPGHVRFNMQSRDVEAFDVRAAAWQVVGDDTLDRWALDRNIGGPTAWQAARDAISAERAAAATQVHDWDASAARKNKRAAARSPLLDQAGILDQVSAPATAESQKEQITGDWKDTQARLARTGRLHQEVAHIFRQIVGEVSAEALSEGDRFIQRWTKEKDHTFQATYWRDQAKKYGLGAQIKEIDEEFSEQKAPEKKGPPAFGDVNAMRRYKTKTRKSLVLDLNKSVAPRSSSGAFARHGSAPHLAGHRRAYHAKIESGEITGTREDWLKHLEEWQTGKDQHQVELLKELYHFEADVRGMDEGPDKQRAERRLERLRGRLGK